MEAFAGPSHDAQSSNAAGRTGGAVAVVIALGFGAYAFLAPATYRATAVVEVERDSSVTMPWPGPLQAAARLRARLLDEELLAPIARSETSMPGATGETLRRRIGASLRVESDDARRFTVSASSSSAAGAQRVSSEFARSAARNVEAILGPRPEGTPAAARASFVPASRPSMPERPDRLLVVVVGLTIAMVWGAGVAVWGAFAETRARKRPRVALSESDQPGSVRELVAEVLRPKDPAAAPARVSAQRVPAGWKPDPSLNVPARRELCETILPFVADGCFVIGVTAVPEVDAQKSRVACELALALSEPDQPRVLLLEADFHSPDIHRVLGLQPPSADGFSDQLRGRGRGTGDDPWHVIDCGRSLHVIAEGAQGSPGMLLSTQFGEAIRSFRTYYDLIVINGPLSSNELDCRVLDAVVDGAIVASTQDGSPFLSRALSTFKRKRFSKVVEV